MLPIINIGPLSLPVPQLVLLLGLWLGSSLVEKQAKQAGKNTEVLFKIIWTAVLAGLIGARISFITRNLGAFKSQWLSIFSLNQSIMDPTAGFLIAITAGYIVAVKNQRSDLALIDELTPLFGVLVTGVYLSNLASGSGFGTLTDLPWGIYLWGGVRHPVQLYYFAASLVVLYLIVFRKRLPEKGSGSSFLFFILYTSGYITVLATYQDPAGNLIAGFRVLQLLAWAVFSISFYIYTKSGLLGGRNEAS